MKKTQIFAFLLAFATVATSLPVIAQATASAETPLNTELLTKSDVLTEANWSDGTGNTLNADVVKVSATGTNTALYMYDKSEKLWNTSDKDTTVATYIYTINKEFSPGTYTIEYNWVAQAPVNETTYVSNGNTVRGNTDILRVKVSGIGLKPDATLNGINKDQITREFTLSSAVSSLPIEIFTWTQNGRAGTLVFPKKFDNFKIYAKGNNTPIVTRNFENGLESGDTWKKKILGGAAVDADLITESDYVRVATVTRTGTVAEAAAAGAYNKAAEYTPGRTITLAPGVYEFSFDGRMSYYFNSSEHNKDEYGYEYNELLKTSPSATPKKGSKITTGLKWIGENIANSTWDSSVLYHKSYQTVSNVLTGGTDYNYRDVKVTVTGKNADNTVDVLGTSTETLWHYWQEGYKFTFTVPVGKTYTLDGISFGGTGFAYDNDAFDVNNFSLKCVSRFTETVTTDDSENFLDRAVENRICGEYTETEAYADGDTENTNKPNGGYNGYISADRRLWYWNNNNLVRKAKIFQLKLNHTVVAGKTYYITMNVRHHSDTNKNQPIRGYFGANNDQVYVAKDLLNLEAGKWENVTYSFKDKAVGKNLYFSLQSYMSLEDIPIDIDNLRIWEDVAADGVYNKTAGDVMLYESDFNDPNVAYIGVGENGLLYNEDDEILSHNFDEPFATLKKSPSDKPDAEPALVYTSLNDGEGHSEGIYKFTADLRVPYYHYENIAAIANLNSLEDAYAYNKHDVNATFNFTNGTETKSSTTKTVVGSVWTGIEIPVIVPAGYTLTDIRIQPDFSAKFDTMKDKWALDYKNVKLCYSDWQSVETEDAENYLDDVTVYVDNAYPTDINNEPDGYVAISARSGDPRPFLYITVDHQPVVGATYYLAFDVMAESEMSFRSPYVNFGIEYTAGKNYSNQMTHAADSDLTTKDWGTSNKVIADTMLAGKEYTFIGTFVPTETASKMEFSIDRGANSAFSGIPMTLDNLKVWYEKDGVSTTVFEEGFDRETSISFLNGKGKCEISQIIPVSKYSVYTPIDPSKEMTVTYDVKLEDDEAVEGKYSFKAQVKLAEESETPAKAQVIFEYSDGSKEYHYMDITGEWSTIGISDRLERNPKLKNVHIVFDSEVPVQLVAPSLTIEYRWQYGKPNTGIVMVLMKLKEMGTRTMKRNVEFIENGKFDDKSAFDFGSVAASYGGLKANAWMNNKNYAGKMEIVTVDGNNVMSVSKISTAAPSSGIALGLGKLTPGDYTLTFDVKLANKGDSCGMRFSVNPSGKPDSYIVSNNNDIRKITANDWTTVTFKFTISTPTEAMVRFRGGMAGEPDTKSFYLDNISLKSVQDVVVRTDGSTPGVGVGDVLAVEGYNEKIAVIDFDDASAFNFKSVVSSYAELKANAWMNNKNYAGNMEIVADDGNNVLSVSGIEVNHSGIALGLGKLEAGDYTVKFEVKLANAGDSCNMRFSVNPQSKSDTYLASDNNDLRKITANEWTTVEFSITLAEPTDVMVRFRGGMGGAADTKPFYLDNIVVEKIG